MDAISVAICGEMQLFREGLAGVLQAPTFTIARVATSLSDIYGDAAAADLPDIVVLGLGVGEDLEDHVGCVTDQVLAGSRLVVLARVPSAGLIEVATKAGVRAVLSTDISGQVLRRTLELVMLGQQVFPAPPGDRAGRSAPMALVCAARSVLTASGVAPAPRLQVQMAPPSGEVQLSEREEQILCRLVGGAPNKTIARELDITDATVKVHIKGLLRKLRVSNRTQAAIWGLNNGYYLDTRRPIVAINGGGGRGLNYIS
jgi:two-component system nitrate/nitrite response regulator NarL